MDRPTVMPLVVQAMDDDAVAIAKALFHEYAESLGIDLEFQGFGEELAGLPGNMPRPMVGCCWQRSMVSPPAAWPCELWSRTSVR